MVLVAGGSKGIGLACAAAFAAEGARIAICSRSRDNVERAQTELKGALGQESALRRVAHGVMRRICAALACFGSFSAMP